uniref:Ig-like domain-containing protein n=1 Tax=Electrophorus electricus TaxID=8005 RepID=A0AAY5EJY3_ELEEL
IQWSSAGVFCADQIGPNQDQDAEVFHEEGQSVTLECSYDSTNQYIDLYWYRQHPNKAPQYLLFKPARSSLNSKDFTVKTERQSSDYQLKVYPARKSHSAVYYCICWDTSSHSDRNYSHSVQKLAHY